MSEVKVTARKTYDDNNSFAIYINNILHIKIDINTISIFSWIDEKEEYKHKIQFVIKGNTEKIVMEYESENVWKDILYHINRNL